jgi:hypothetical protein
VAQSYITGTGPFQYACVGEELKEEYKTVPEGTPVVFDFVWCCTSERSRELAKALDADPWDPTTHHLSASQLSRKTVALLDFGKQFQLEDKVHELLKWAEVPCWVFYFRP